MKNNRMETLNSRGIDTSKYFTLTVNEDMPRGTKINIEVDKAYSEIAQQIKEDGYVKNSRLHRRFVMAQYMRMLNSGLGWHGYLNTNYGYMYQFEMMTEEVRVLTKLEKKDRVVFKERSSFFTIKTIHQVLSDYVKSTQAYLNTLQIKKCKGRPYIYIPGFGNCFTDEIDLRVLNPIRTLVDVCKKCWNYSEIYNLLCALNRVMIKLPYETPKSKAWVNAFQASGAYYTLRNMVMYHNVAMPLNGVIYNGDLAVYALNCLLNDYQGYQFNALLKKTIEYNNFNFKESISK